MKKIKDYKALFLLLALVLIACGGKKGGKATGAEIKEQAISVYVFDVGDILVKNIGLFNPGVDEGQTKRFANSAYLIRHPKGDLIWDTGLPDALAANPEGNDSPGFTMKLPKTLSSQLAAIGVDPLEVEYLAVSHSHGDHTGNMNLFRNATVLLQEEEYQFMFEVTRPNPVVDSIRTNEHIKLKGDHDVFGDSTVVIKRATGHTAGHQVLYLNLPETGPVVLSGDLWHFTKNRELKGVPLFNFNADSTLAAMDRIESFLSETGARLWIQHDFEQQQGIAHSPNVIK